ncbi:Spindle assembly checkpoint component MAD1 [Nakaseomyces glabratus]|nr:Spindle assembly checkpoint component MAD1 [Nakaseomyces glabratus]
MNNSGSGGSSPFVESPDLVSDGHLHTERKDTPIDVDNWKYKYDNLLNQYEIEKVRWQKEQYDSEKSHEALHLQLEKARNEIDQLVESKRFLEAQLQSEHPQNTQKEWSHEDNKVNNNSMNNDYMLLEEKYKSDVFHLDNSVNELKLELTSCRSLLKKYEEVIEQQSEQIKEIKKTLKKKEQELDEIEVNRLKQAHNATNTEEIRQQTNENASFSNGYNTLMSMKNSVNYWKNENQQLNQKLSEYSDIYQQLQEAQLEIMELKANLEEWNKFLSNKKQQDNSNDYSIDHFIIEFESQRRELNMVTEELAEVKKSYYNSKILNDELALERNQLLKLKDDYENNIINLEKLNHELEQQKVLLEEECSLLKNQIPTKENLNQQIRSTNRNDAEYDSLLDNYKQETENLTNELKRLNDSLIEHNRNQGTEMKKRKLRNGDHININYSQRLNELQQNNLSLEKDNEKLRLVVEKLEGKLDDLRKTKPKNIRILQQRDSPLLKLQFVRRKENELLREENQNLLTMIENITENRNESFDKIPLTSYNSLKYQYEISMDTNKKQEKKFSRLKQIFNKKSLEFIDVVNSLLGFKLEFQQDGRVKIYSCYMPNKYLIANLVDNTLKSNLDTVISDWDSLLNDWVVEKGQLPCFLASLTLQLWKMENDS